MPQAETKICQNCKQKFTIEPEDFEFYQKIKVPAPTFCRTCKMQRLMTWRNERSLYKRKCTAPGHRENTISIFSSDKPFKVYDHKYWWSDEWDPLSCGREYNFLKPFFRQFRELLERIPLLQMFNDNAVNSEYCNHAAENKDCYMAFGVFRNQGLLYANRCGSSKDSMDVYMGEGVELNYETIMCRNSYRLFFSQECENCNDSIFLYNCRGCSYCLACSNLRNKQYYIFNKPYSKEEYLRKLNELDLGSFTSLQKIKENFQNISNGAIRRFANLHNTINSTGDNLREVKNCKICFDVFEAENCTNVTWAGYNLKDAADSFGVGVGELVYEGVDELSSRTVGSFVIWKGSYDIYYSYNCHGCNNLFGCIGLRNKSYCILNKQYTKEEYEELVPKIIQHMNDMPYVDKKGRIYKYGEFFPPELSPFCYNETIAQEYFPLTKEQVIEQGYSWKDPEPREYEITVQAKDLPDDIKDVKDDILEQVIGCAHQQRCNEQCTQAFKIIEPELQFYKRMNLPLPRLCPNCRHYQRLKQRNPLKLWHRQCQCAGKTSSNGIYQNTTEHFHGTNPCPNEFETTYALERPEIVYCEKCYLAEVV